MGREVRRVPENWEHPRDANGKYIPLFEGPYRKAMAEWKEDERKWNAREDRYAKPEHYEKYTFEEWHGEAPMEEDYMPEWSDAERTHLVMYENTSEGTPMSPAFETPEELARWLVDNNASSFGSMTASYEQWLAMCKRGWAPSMAGTPETGLRSGVEHVGDMDK